MRNVTTNDQTYNCLDGKKKFAALKIVLFWIHKKASKFPYFLITEMVFAENLIVKMFEGII
jgi:hypothetical protein